MQLLKKKQDLGYDIARLLRKENELFPEMVIIPSELVHFYSGIMTTLRVATIKRLVSLFRVARPAGFALSLPGGGKSSERWHRTVRTQTAAAVGEEILRSVVEIGWMGCIKTREVNTPLESIHSQWMDRRTRLNEPKKKYISLIIRR